MAIHLHLLPDGKILTWADDDSLMPTRLGDFSKAFVVAIPPNDRPASTVVEIDNTVTNLFCAGHAFLPDGRLLVVGGHEGAGVCGLRRHHHFRSRHLCLGRRAPTRRCTAAGGMRAP